MKTESWEQRTTQHMKPRKRESSKKGGPGQTNDEGLAPLQLRDSK